MCVCVCLHAFLFFTCISVHMHKVDSLLFGELQFVPMKRWGESGWRGKLHLGGGRAALCCEKAEFFMARRSCDAKST